MRANENAWSLGGYCDLIIALALKELKARYKTAKLGLLWAFIKPALLLIMLSLIFTKFVPLGIESYPLFLLSGLLPWLFFASSIEASTPAFVENSNLIKKIYFPRQILPFSIIAASFFQFLASLVLLLPLMIVFEPALSHKIALLPLIIAVHLVLISGIALMTSSLNAYYRDVKYILEAALIVWFYATPVIYPLSMVPKGLWNIYILNPMVGFVSLYRAALAGGSWPGADVLVATLSVTVASALAGALVFKKYDGCLADFA